MKEVTADGICFLRSVKLPRRAHAAGAVHCDALHGKQRRHCAQQLRLLPPRGRPAGQRALFLRRVWRDAVRARVRHGVALRRAGVLAPRVPQCSRKRADGSYYILPETVANAATLAKGIMQRYGIDTEHVVRHYDVTGKRCPMPWVDDPAQWTAFLATLMPEHPNEEEEGPMTRYNKIDDMPAWARSDAQRLIDRGALRGNERGELDLSPDMLRTLIVCQRMVDQAKET